MRTDTTHHWVSGGLRADRERVAGALELPPPLLDGGSSTVDAHRRLRGPYTLAGTVLRALAHHLPGLPELVRRHEVEILTMAPELLASVPATRETLTSLAVPAERTRFYSAVRTLRIAHGAAELLRDALRGLPAGAPRSLIVENIQDADPTDAELVTVLLRRIDPALLTLVVCAGPAPEPGTDLLAALRRYAVRHDVPPSGVDSALVSGVDSAAAAYVAGDCTSDDPALLAAYAALGPARRAALHDARADELAARGEESLRWGAIPYHREQGSDPAGTGAAALRYALETCVDLGFYAATVELGQRGRAVVDWAAQGEHWWAFTTKMTTSLAALGRAEEAERLYAEARAFTANPAVHRQAAYATAMLYTRHHDEQRRDNQVARGWINTARALARLEPEGPNRSFQSVFMDNGLALVEAHLRDYPAALALVDEGIARLDRELAPDDHRLHRSVLRHNRAQVHLALGNLDAALADLDAVIAADPNHPEYHLDRGNLLRQLGRDKEALTDYDTAARLSPPFVEVHYNRADTLLALDDVAGGLAGLDYVLELDPAFLDALVNRAGVRAALGDAPGAAADVAAGLAIDPANPHLLCVSGQLAADAGRTDEALAAFDATLAADPDQVSAWSGRAALALDRGDTATAIADLTHALDLADDPALRYNRAAALRAAGQWHQAVADLERAQALDPADPDIATALAHCRARTG
jgi:tetratricopeptide (TPR) repeat protein